MDRDMEVHRLTARLRALRRFGLDLCLGRMVGDGRSRARVRRTTRPHGQHGSSAADRLALSRGRAVLRSDPRQPDGSGSRRRYRWTRGRISDYWDEVFTAGRVRRDHAALDDQSAFIASLGSNRSARMRDVLGTIQADQDAIIRAGSRGALVVDGGPGTGKTVVALHRAAYLLYSDPRLGHRRGGVLFVGPHQPYLAYVADVLPSLGEEGVQTCTLRDLVPEGATAAIETDPDVARLKSSADMVRAIEPAVRFYEEPPTEGMTVATDWSDIWLSADDWAEAFGAPDPALRTTRRATRSGRSCSRSWWTSTTSDDDDLGRPAPHVAAAERGAAHDLQPRLAADRRGRPRRRPVVRARLPAHVRSLAQRRRRAAAAARGRRRPGRCPTCRSWTPHGSGSATRRRRDGSVGIDAAVAAEREEMARVVDDLIAADDAEMARV